MVDVGLMIEYESGQMEAKQVLKLFAELVKTGDAWTLQGSYGRMAQRLIDAGYIDKQGNILKEIE